MLLFLAALFKCSWNAFMPHLRSLCKWSAQATTSRSAIFSSSFFSARACSMRRKSCSDMPRAVAISSSFCNSAARLSMRRSRSSLSCRPTLRTSTFCCAVVSSTTSFCPCPSCLSNACPSSKAHSMCARNSLPCLCKFACNSPFPASAAISMSSFLRKASRSPFACSSCRFKSSNCFCKSLIWPSRSATSASSRFTLRAPSSCHCKSC
mmetsp:Transcript_30782/g.88925  ORF Transcript_30782/g.88925 Transcript_30782/m.88925 type:complete len:208 (-) Transcript_30782:48-671(-)